MLPRHEIRAQIAAERTSLEIQIANLATAIARLKEIETASRMHHQSLKSTKVIMLKREIKE